MPMITSPAVGFVLGVLTMLLLWGVIAAMARAGGWLARMARPKVVNSFFGKAQIFSAAYMGYAHGHNDAQKTMGIIALTLFGAEASGALDNLPGWLAFLHPSDAALAAAKTGTSVVALLDESAYRQRLGSGQEDRVTTRRSAWEDMLTGAALTLLSVDLEGEDEARPVPPLEAALARDAAMGGKG